MRPLRDVTRRPAIDGLGGALGIDDLSLREQVATARMDLIKFRVLSEVRGGTREVDLAGRDMHELPDDIVPDLASFRSLGLARNFLVGGASHVCVCVRCVCVCCLCACVCVWLGWWERVEDGSVAGVMMWRWLAGAP